MSLSIRRNQRTFDQEDRQTICHWLAEVSDDLDRTFDLRRESIGTDVIVLTTPRPRADRPLKARRINALS
jgi:hypothetical protein